MTDEDILEKFADQRVKCEIWTRVMGYHRPLTAFNKGKLQEHKERRKFVESKVAEEQEN